MLLNIIDPNFKLKFVVLNFTIEWKKYTLSVSNYKEYFWGKKFDH
jgi:hypothetical protein